MEDNKKEVVEEVVETEGEKETESSKKKVKKSKVDITKEPDFIALQEENAKLLDQLLRKQAEFENYKKRSQKEKDGIYGMITGDVFASTAFSKLSIIGSIVATTSPVIIP